MLTCLSPLLSSPDAHFGQVKRSAGLLENAKLITLSLLASPVIAHGIFHSDKALAARDTGSGGGFTGGGVGNTTGGGGGGIPGSYSPVGPTHTAPGDYYNQPPGAGIPARSFTTGTNNSGVSTGQTTPRKGPLDCFTVSALERKGGWQPQGYDRDQLRVAFHQEYNAKLPYVGNLLKAAYYRLGGTKAGQTLAASIQNYPENKTWAGKKAGGDMLFVLKHLTNPTRTNDSHLAALNIHVNEKLASGKKRLKQVSV